MERRSRFRKAELIWNLDPFTAAAAAATGLDWPDSDVATRGSDETTNEFCGVIGGFKIIDMDLFGMSLELLLLLRDKHCIFSFIIEVNFVGDKVGLIDLSECSCEMSSTLWLEDERVKLTDGMLMLALVSIFF